MTLSEEAEDASIGVALSGGGKRASLFSLGALAALVDVGLNRSIRTVSLVSGGSITNAAVGCAFPDFSEISPPDMWAFHNRLLKELSERRHMFRIRWILGLTTLVFLLQRSAPIVFLQRPLYSLSPGGEASLKLPGASFAINALVYLFLLVVVFRARTFLQSVTIYRCVIYPGLSLRERVASYTGLRLREIVDKERRAARLLRLDDSSVNHTLCVTDLRLGAPVYLNGSQLVTVQGLYSTTGELSLTRAVTASAAFPGAFFPARVSFSVPETEERPAKRLDLVVSDGGAWNNLGTDWLLAGTALSALPNVVVGDQEHSYPWWESERPAITIVVDSSAEWRGEPIPDNTFTRYWPLGSLQLELLYFKKVLSIVYAAGLMARQRLLWNVSRNEESGVLYIDMESPLEIATSYADSDNPAISERAKIAVERLLALRSSADWSSLSQRTRRMKTTLKKVKRDLAWELSYHGYHSVITTLWIRFGIQHQIFIEEQSQGHEQQGQVRPT